MDGPLESRWYVLQTLLWAGDNASAAGADAVSRHWRHAQRCYLCSTTYAVPDDAVDRRANGVRGQGAHAQAVGAGWRTWTIFERTVWRARAGALRTWPALLCFPALLLNRGAATEGAALRQPYAAARARRGSSSICYPAMVCCLHYNVIAGVRRGFLYSKKEEGAERKAGKEKKEKSSTLRGGLTVSLFITVYSFYNMRRLPSLVACVSMALNHYCLLICLGAASVEEGRQRAGAGGGSGSLLLTGVWFCHCFPYLSWILRTFTHFSARTLRTVARRTCIFAVNSTFSALLPLPAQTSLSMAPRNLLHIKLLYFPFLVLFLSCGTVRMPGHCAKGGCRIGQQISGSGLSAPGTIFAACASDVAYGSAVVPDGGRAFRGCVAAGHCCTRAACACHPACLPALSFALLAPSHLSLLIS